MLRIGYEYAGFAATTSTTKGGEDTFNPSSVESKQDSLHYSDDGGQGRKSENSSEDQRSDEDFTSTSTTDSEMEYDEEPCSDVINCDFPDV